MEYGSYSLKFDEFACAISESNSKYSFLTSGFKMNTNQFFTYIPHEYLLDNNINSFIECFKNNGASYGEILPQLSGKNKPVSGKLVLFPSHVKHKVLPLTSNENRYTISFNTFLSGVLGEDSRSVYLNLKAKSVREMMEENKT